MHKSKSLDVEENVNSKQEGSVGLRLKSKHKLSAMPFGIALLLLCRLLYFVIEIRCHQFYIPPERLLDNRRIGINNWQSSKQNSVIHLTINCIVLQIVAAEVLHLINIVTFSLLH